MLDESATYSYLTTIQYEQIEQIALCSVVFVKATRIG
jgi:hypothetical protein